MHRANSVSMDEWEAHPVESLRLQISDGSFARIYHDPKVLNIRAMYKVGRDFALTGGAHATWIGGGWWRITGTHDQIRCVISKLRKLWEPVPMQKSISMRPAESKPASRETAMAAIARCREILARPKA